MPPSLVTDERPRPLNQRLRGALRYLYDPDPVWREGAIKNLIHEALAMEKALGFYAQPSTWFDGVAMTTHKGLSTVPDDGFEAQWALHLVDVAYPIHLTPEALNALTTNPDAGAAGGGHHHPDPEWTDPLAADAVWQRPDDGHDDGRGEG